MTTQETIRPLAPEDVRAGDVIVVMSRIVDPNRELDAYDIGRLRETGASRLAVRSEMPEQPELARVESVCVPLVLARDAAETVRVFDLRQVQLARVDAVFGDAAMTALAADAARARAEGLDADLPDVHQLLGRRPGPRRWRWRWRRGR